VSLRKVDINDLHEVISSSSRCSFCAFVAPTHCPETTLLPRHEGSSLWISKNTRNSYMCAVHQKQPSPQAMDEYCLLRQRKRKQRQGQLMRSDGKRQLWRRCVAAKTFTRGNHIVRSCPLSNMSSRHTYSRQHSHKYSTAVQEFEHTPQIQS